MTNIICNECETVAHCMKNGCIPEQPAYRAVKTYHEGKPVYVAEQPAQPLVVPDLLTAHDPETLEYRNGWNDCRQLMMEILRKNNE